MTDYPSISKLRAALDEAKEQSSLTTLRAEFERRKKEEWDAIRQEHLNSVPERVRVAKLDIGREMVRLSRQGAKKGDLARAYGTKDYATVNRLMAEAKEFLYDDIEDTGPDFTLARSEWDGYPEVYILVAENYEDWNGEVYLYPDEDGDAMVIPDSITEGFQGSTVHREIVGGIASDFSTHWRTARGL